MLQESTLQKIIQFSYRYKRILQTRITALNALNIESCLMFFADSDGKLLMLGMQEQFIKDMISAKPALLPELFKLSKIEFSNESSTLAHLLSLKQQYISNVNNAFSYVEPYNNGILISIFFSTDMSNSQLMSGIDEINTFIDCVKKELTTTACSYLEKIESNSDLAAYVESYFSQEQVKLFPKEYISSEGVRMSPKEAECLTLYMHGASYQEIADRLFISKHTVSNHLKMIKSKFNISTPLQLVYLFKLISGIYSSSNKLIYV
ncbi:helix-turn-helix transcriptional regulator [Cysteiniphilum litorale]|uniref:helix-turn-helix transcriptional regulator n=1 Tax=Cysteiniphilum litorale TaxID=2056700 RepID=UPI003F880D53